MKRIISLVLLISLAFLVPAWTFAANGDEKSPSDNAKLNTNSETIEEKLIEKNKEGMGGEAEDTAEYYDAEDTGAAYEDTMGAEEYYDAEDTAEYYDTEDTGAAYEDTEFYGDEEAYQDAEGTEEPYTAETSEIKY